MNKKYIIIIAALALAGGAAALIARSIPIRQTPFATPSAQQAGSPSQQGEAKTSDQDGITVTVAPTQLSSDDTTWKFSVTLDTHSGSLDQDMVQSAKITDSSGAAYAPITWEGAGPGGHHREGVLSFSAIQPSPEYVELVLRGIGAGSVRTFRWNIARAGNK